MYVRLRARETSWPLLCTECQGYMATARDGLCDGCAYFRAGVPPGTWLLWREIQELAAQGLALWPKEGEMGFDWNDFNADFEQHGAGLLKGEDKDRLVKGETVFDVVKVRYSQKTKFGNPAYFVDISMPDGEAMGTLAFTAGSGGPRDIKLAGMMEALSNGQEAIKGVKLVTFDTQYANKGFDLVKA